MSKFKPGQVWRAQWGMYARVDAVHQFVIDYTIVGNEWLRKKGHPPGTQLQRMELKGRGKRAFSSRFDHLVLPA